MNGLEWTLVVLCLLCVPVVLLLFYSLCVIAAQADRRMGE